MKRRSLAAPPAALLAVACAFVAPAHASVQSAKSGCSYLKASEVRQVLDTKVKKAAKPPAPPTARVCGYKVLGKNRTVNLWVQQGTAGKAGFDNAKATFKADAENVSGIAKKAFYVSGGLNTLYLLKRDTLVYVQYVALDVEDDAAIKQAVTDLAKIVVKRV